MTVVIENSRCILCGVCETLAPFIFKQEIGVEVNQETAKQYYDYTLLAIEACPTACIEEI